MRVTISIQKRAQALISRMGWRIPAFPTEATSCYLVIEVASFTLHTKSQNVTSVEYLYITRVRARTNNAGDVNIDAHLTAHPNC